MIASGNGSISAFFARYVFQSTVIGGMKIIGRQRCRFECGSKAWRQRSLKSENAAGISAIAQSKHLAAEKPQCDAEAIVNAHYGQKCAALKGLG